MRFRDRSIASKLTRIVAGTTAMAILLAMLIFSAASIFKVYGDAQDKFLTLTRLVSQSSQGAVAFRDRQSAENILGALQAEP